MTSPYNRQCWEFFSLNLLETGCLTLEWGFINIGLVPFEI